MSDATVHRWDDLPTDHPMAKIDRRRIVGDHVMLAQLTLHEGFFIDQHHHENEQIVICLSGRMRFTLGEEREIVEIGGGEVLHVPSNVLHGAEALETSVLIDVFSPVSETTGVDQG